MATIFMHTLFFQINYSIRNLGTFDRKLASKMCRLSSSDASFTRISCSVQSSDAAVNRRSANYKPPFWDFDFIQSLNSKYVEERYMTKALELKEKVKLMLEDQESSAVDKLELIDDLQKMGICYHFKDEIKKILTSFYKRKCVISNEESKEFKDLYSTALEFRLLREHGFAVSQGIFDCFMNEEGEFKPCLREDIKGLLQLYEASHLLTENEETLEVAREFATFFLNKNLEEGNGIDENLSLLVRYSLEMPLHLRVRRPNARWFIEEYGRREDANPVFLQFAKLDFNIVQATHQQELKHVSRWWKRTGLAEKLPFARDRLVECYFWNIGWLSGPQNGYSRISLAKVNSIITIMDDIFDVYGTLEELQVFNDVIQRWDVEAIDQLPNCMHMCFLELNNLVDETAHYVLKHQKLVLIPRLRKLWKDLSKTYLKEAEWYVNGYTPSLEEYMNNAWISIGSDLIPSSALFIMTCPMHEKAMQTLFKYKDLIRSLGIIFRLTNDLGTSKEEMERGDASKSIQCYMNETGESKEKAIEHMKGLIHRAWKKMNEELLQATDCIASRKFVEIAANLSRMSTYMYQHGDGHGNQNPQIKKRISSLLFEPFVI